MERRWYLQVLSTPLASALILQSASKRLQQNWPSENQWIDSVEYSAVRVEMRKFAVAAYCSADPHDMGGNAIEEEEEEKEDNEVEVEEKGGGKNVA
eukprot:5296527-Pyramimonas_sp.AAC.1